MDIIARNNVRVLGAGSRPLLFAHGFGCDQNMWRYLYPAFEHDYRIVLFDYVGSGKSDLSAFNTERYSDLNGYAEDMLEVIRTLGLQKVTLVGHSVSSMIGILAAVKEPALFERLIFISPSPCYINAPGYIGGFEREEIDELMETMRTNYIGWANFLGPAIMQHPERPELSAELTESFCSTDPVTAGHFARATFYSDNRPDLPRLKLPSLIIQCTDDLIAPVAVGEYMHRVMPDSSLTLIETSGHCPHMSAPQETIAAIDAFMHAPIPAN